MAQIPQGNEQETESHNPVSEENVEKSARVALLRNAIALLILIALPLAANFILGPLQFALPSEWPNTQELISDGTLPSENIVNIVSGVLALAWLGALIALVVGLVSRSRRGARRPKTSKAGRRRSSGPGQGLDTIETHPPSGEGESELPWYRQSPPIFEEPVSDFQTQVIVTSSDTEDVPDYQTIPQGSSGGSPLHAETPGYFPETGGGEGIASQEEFSHYGTEGQEWQRSAEGYMDTPVITDTPVTEEVIPRDSTRVLPAEAPEIIPVRAYYISRPDDTLRSISAQFLNSPARWKELRTLNAAYPTIASLEADDLVPIGSALMLPGDPMPWGKPDPVFLWTLAERFLYAAWGREPDPAEVVPFWRGLAHGAELETAALPDIEGLPGLGAGQPPGIPEAPTSDTHPPVSPPPPVAAPATAEAAQTFTAEPSQQPSADQSLPEVHEGREPEEATYYDPQPQPSAGAGPDAPTTTHAPPPVAPPPPPVQEEPTQALDTPASPAYEQPPAPPEAPHTYEAPPAPQEPPPPPPDTPPLSAYEPPPAPPEAPYTYETPAAGGYEPSAPAAYEPPPLAPEEFEEQEAPPLPKFMPSMTGADPSTRISEQSIIASRRSLAGTAIGDAMLLWQLSRLRRRRGDSGEQAHDPLEESLRQSARMDSLRLIEAAMRHLRSVTVAQLRRKPKVVAVRVGTYGFEVLLDQPTEAPDYWVAASGGYVLELAEGVTIEHLDSFGQGLSLCPALVPVGDTVEGPLLLNFEEIGCLAISGPEPQSTSLLSAIVEALGSSPMAESVRVIALGVDTPQGPGWERVMSTSFDSPHLEELLVRASKSEPTGGDAELDVLVVGPGHDILIQRAGQIAVSPGSNLALVGATSSAAARWPWRIHIDATSRAVVQPIAFTMLAAQAMSPDIAASLMASASENPNYPPGY